MSEGKQSPTARAQRVIRVFVSSTFKDMHEEREELIKRVFPQLRKLCESRGVVWGEVDLRWGIPDEAKAEGQVLPICLAEIHRCRPYFIGLLGERYGWVPEEIPSELIAQEPWLQEHLHHSVTELEILHGVLNNPVMADHAFFYLRDPVYAASRPPDKQADFTESPTPEEIARFGPEEAQRKAEDRRGKLATLKQRLRISGLPLRENYRDPKELGELVLRDLTGVIDRLFPEGSQPDPLDREASEHEAYARSRGRVYLHRQEYFDRLDRHVESDDPPLIILGEPGVGKSALLANWGLRFQASQGLSHTHLEGSFWGRLQYFFQSRFKPFFSQPLLISHFIGASAVSTDLGSMLRRLMRELKRHFSLRSEISDRPEAMRQAFNAARKRESGENAAELKAAINAGTNPTLKVTFFEIPNIPPDRPDTQAFADFLHQASGRGRVVIILDALDQLEDKSGALDLDWLPTEIPQNIRLILSTGLGRPLETLKSRGWLENSLTVTLLTLEERQRFIRSYLGQFRKELSPKLAERLATTPAAAHPLYLKAILDEMRVFGFHEHLEEHLSHYLGAATVVGLYERILERWEQDFDLNRPGMVQEAMTLLWAARRGLAEAELLDLLGDGSNPLPGAFWSPLYLAAENVLIKQTGPLLFLADKLEIICHPGLLKFANSAFRQAVQNRYLSREPVWLAAHRRLADYFEKIRGQDHRPLDELPWQLAQAREWRRLYQLLGDPIFFASAWENNPVEVKGYWLLLKEHLSFQLPEAYHQVLENPGQYHRAASHLSRLMTDIGYLKEAQSLDVFLVEHYRRAGDLGKLAYALDRLATTNVVQGELLEAMALQQERQRLFLESQDLEGLAATLGKQAVILHLQGRLKEAMDMHKKEERLYRKLRDKPGLAVSLNNQALILKDWGKLKNAMELLKKVERFYRDLGDKSGLRKTLHNQAKVLDHLWKDEDALALLQEEERLCQELGDLASLSLCRALQGWILLCKMGRPEGLNLIKEAAQLATKHGLPKETIIIRGYLNRLGLS